MGINDYLFIDGYQRVLEAKANGRLQNIALVLPVIELRLDTFSGTDSDWKRVNYHVLFSDQVEPADIKTHFLNRLDSNHSLWQGVIDQRTLVEFGQRVLDSIPSHKRKGTPRLDELAFQHLTFPLTHLRDILRKTTAFGNRYVTAVGKAEWANMRWEKGIADKRTVIDSVDFLFTAGESPEACRRAQRKLIDEGVTKPLLDCSDAHHPLSSSEKDRLGHCYTWLKADTTFAGLRQVLNDPEGRVFLGDKPPKLAIVEQNPTKFVNSLTITKVPDSPLQEEWFGNTVELSHDFVAIIGNKGMGKSALTDILALTGRSDAPSDSYGFLDSHHFRDRDAKAAHFVARATWAGGPPTESGLADPVPTSSVPRVRYIPQHYFEDLCNDLTDARRLQRELQKVIYSHLDESETLGHATLQELINDRTAEADRQIAALRARLSDVNRKIIHLERATTATQFATLDSERTLKEAELAAHDAAMPVAVAAPQTPEATPALDAALAERKAAQEQLELLRTELASDRGHRASALDLEARLFAFSEAALRLKEEAREGLAALGLQFDDVVKIQLDTGMVIARRQDLEAKIALAVSQQGELSARVATLQTEITNITDALGAPERAYQQYQELLVAWQEQRKTLLQSIASLRGRQNYLRSPAHDELLALRAERASLSTLIHEQQLGQASFQRGLYARLQAQLAAHPIIAKSLPFEFDARLVDTGLATAFNEMINHTTRGHFTEPEAIAERLRASDINDSRVLTNTLEAIVSDLFDGRDIDNLERQLKKAYSVDDIYQLLFSLQSLDTRYSLRIKGRELAQLTPGERGSVLLVFYLLADNDERPLIIDQPEENLDNQSLYELVVPCIDEAKKRRQIIMVTHNPNLAVVCDAEQIIWCHIDKEHGHRVTYQTGSLENPTMNRHVVDVLEGTWPAFKTRTRRYQE